MLISTLNLSGIWMSNTIIDRFQERTNPNNREKDPSLAQSKGSGYLSLDATIGRGHFLPVEAVLSEDVPIFTFPHQVSTILDERCHC